MGPIKYMDALFSSFDSSMDWTHCPLINRSHVQSAGRKNEYAGRKNEYATKYAYK